MSPRRKPGQLKRYANAPRSLIKHGSVAVRGLTLRELEWWHAKLWAIQNGVGPKLLPNLFPDARPALLCPPKVSLTPRLAIFASAPSKAHPYPRRLG